MKGKYLSEVMEKKKLSKEENNLILAPIGCGKTYYCVNVLMKDISKKYWVCMAEKGDKGDIAPQYDSFITLSNNIWDYSESDKIVIPENLSINQLIINNAYDGCCGMIITKQDIVLPDNSDCSLDYYYAEVMNNDEYYVYTFVYRSTSSNSGRFMWNRTVYGYKVVD